MTDCAISEMEIKSLQVVCLDIPFDLELHLQFNLKLAVENYCINSEYLKTQRLGKKGWLISHFFDQN